MKSVDVHVLSPDASKKVYTYNLLMDDTREDVLRRCVMQYAFRNKCWWSEIYKEQAKKLDIKEMPHSYLYNAVNGDVYQVLKEEYDK